MKRFAWICIGAMTLTSLACGVKDKSDIATRYAKLKADNKPTADGKTQTTAQGGTCTGGAPGAIAVSGKLINNGILIDHVSLTQIMGKKDSAAKDQTVNTPSKQSSEIEKATQEKLDGLAKVQTYLNLGCPADDVMKNGTAVQLPAIGNSGLLNVEVNTIYICDKSKLTEIPDAFATLLADRIVMKNASLSMADSISKSLSIIANTIEVTGTNVIRVKTKDSLQFAEMGASLSVNITKEAKINGTLALQSVGGVCLQQATTEKDSTDSGLDDSSI